MKARKRCAVCGKIVRSGSGVSRGARVLHAKCVASFVRNAQPAPVDFKSLAAGDRD